MHVQVSKKMFKLIFFFVFLSAKIYQMEAYKFSAIFIQPLSPAGIRISIPDEPGISLVAFHVKINDEFVGLEAGTIARDIVKKTKGYWVYHDESTKLHKGDTVYYWIHVIYKNLSYDLNEQKYTVKDFFDYNGNKICTENCSNSESNETHESKESTESKPVNNCQTQRYFPPVPLIESLAPVGIRMSIPDKKGISLVAFHVKFNHEFVGLEAGTIAGDIVKAKNGQWTYYDKTTELKKGDTIYYWIHVIYEGLGYNLVEQEYKVTDFFDENGKNTTESNNDHKTKESRVETTTKKSIDNNKTTKSTSESTTTQSSNEKKTTKPTDKTKNSTSNSKL